MQYSNNRAFGWAELPDRTGVPSDIRSIAILEYEPDASEIGWFSEWLQTGKSDQNRVRSEFIGVDARNRPFNAV